MMIREIIEKIRAYKSKNQYEPYKILTNKECSGNKYNNDTMKKRISYSQR